MYIEAEKICEIGQKLLDSYQEEIELIEEKCNDSMEEAYKKNSLQKKQNGVLDFIDKLGFNFTLYTKKPPVKLRFKIFPKE